MPKKGKLKEFYKGHKKLSIILIVLGVLFLIPVSYLLMRFISLSGPVNTTRSYPSYFKGYWNPVNAPFETISTINNVKEMNMNVLSIGPIIYNSPFRGLINTLMLSVIKKAKNQGLSVHVVMQCHGPGYSNPADSLTSEELDLWADRVVEWAVICEEYGVEYFTPAGEVDHCMGLTRAVNWHSKVLPRVRTVFSGEVLSQWAGFVDEGENINRSEAYVRNVEASTDFDGVILDLQIMEEWQLKYYFNSSKRLESGDPWLPASLEEIVLSTSEKADDLELPIFMGEVSVAGTDFISELTKSVGMQSKTGMGATDEEAVVIFNKTLNSIIPYYDGVIITPWPKNTLASQTISEILETI